jgi:hypothetical protein
VESERQSERQSASVTATLDGSSHMIQGGGMETGPNDGIHECGSVDPWLAIKNDHEVKRFNSVDSVLTSAQCERATSEQRHHGHMTFSRSLLAARKFNLFRLATPVPKTRDQFFNAVHQLIYSVVTFNHLVMGQFSDLMSEIFIG